MGMAASQARFLTITARKTQSQVQLQEQIADMIW